MTRITLLKTDQFYKHQNQVNSPVDLSSIDLEDHTKLSLFCLQSLQDTVLSDVQDINSQFEKIYTLLNGPFYFKKIDTKTLAIWEVYAVLEDLKHWLKSTVNQTDFDYLLWPEKHFTPPKLLIFDMDSTFIQIEVIDELAKEQGVGDSVEKITESAMRGELDFCESLMTRVSLLKGLQASSIDKISKQLPLSKGVLELVRKSKAQSVKIAIVSGGFMPFVERLKSELSLYEVKANHLEITNGKLTGKVIGGIVDAKVKANFVLALQTKLALNKNDIITIGDGANDLLMMRESGFSLAYYAKPPVQVASRGRMNYTNLNHLSALFGW